MPIFFCISILTSGWKYILSLFLHLKICVFFSQRRRLLASAGSRKLQSGCFCSRILDCYQESGCSPQPCNQGRTYRQIHIQKKDLNYLNVYLQQMLGWTWLPFVFFISLSHTSLTPYEKNLTTLLDMSLTVNPQEQNVSIEFDLNWHVCRCWKLNSLLTVSLQLMFS